MKPEHLISRATTPLALCQRSFEFTDKEQKLCLLALDGSASEGEIQNCSISLIRSLRRRYRDGHALLRDIAQQPAPPRQPPTTVSPCSDVRMTFGRYRGRRLRDIRADYLLWVLRECKNADPYLREGYSETPRMKTKRQPLISADNHLFPGWCPDWLRKKVEAPDCSGGTHPALRDIAKWLTIYFAEHPGGAERWLYHAAQLCDRDVDDTELDRLLLWASAIFGDGTSGSTTSNWQRVAPPPVDLEKIYQIAIAGPRLVQYRESSPVQLHSAKERNTVHVLEAWARYADQINPWICFGSRDSFQTRRLSRCESLLYAHEQVVPSPMKAQFGRTADGRLSEHTLDGTGPRIFLVAEFDFARLTPRGKPTIWVPLLDRCEAAGLTVLDINAALLAHLALDRPLWMTVFSGSKSLQGWFPCCGVREDTLYDWFHGVAKPIGTCNSTWCKSQFVRCPDGTRAPNREGKSVRQSIEYFNPAVL
jgi:hypothetical protein